MLLVLFTWASTSLRMSLYFSRNFRSKGGFCLASPAERHNAPVHVRFTKLSHCSVGRHEPQKHRLVVLEAAETELLAQRRGVQRGQGEADHHPADQHAEDHAAGLVDLRGKPHFDLGELIGDGAEEDDEDGEQAPEGDEVPAVGITGHPGVQLIGHGLEVVGGQQGGGHHGNEPQGVAPHPFGKEEADAEQQDHREDAGEDHGK